MTLPGSDRLIVVVGPSGAGKDSVLGAWAALWPAAGAPVPVQRVITRPPDSTGEHHEPVDDAAFERLHAAGAFAFSWAAHGLRYGVRLSALAPLADGRWVVMNGSRAHLAALRRTAPLARVVEITAPAGVLAARLAQRGREDPAAVQARLARAAPAADAALVVVNTGDVAESAAALHRWWCGLDGRAGAPG